MRAVLSLLLMVFALSCTAPQEVPEAHIIMDAEAACYEAVVAVCRYTARCEPGVEFTNCITAMHDKGFAACSAVTEKTVFPVMVDECSAALRDESSCEWPTKCDFAK